MLSKAAPFRRRVYAYAIDQLLLSFAVGYPLSMGGGNVFDNLRFAGAVTVFFSIFYWALMDFWFGQSLGKQAVKIRTLGIAKTKVSFLQALLRSLPKAFPALLLLDCIPLLFGGDSRFSDRVANTRVIEWAGLSMENKTIVGILLLIAIFAASLLAGGFMKSGSLVVLDKKIAIVKLHGTIGEVGAFGAGRALDPESTAGLIRQAADSQAVGAIVLDVDSEGGGSSATQMLVETILQARNKKPVVAYVSDVGASGGYWIAASASKLVVAPLSITGSIGVISDFVDASRFLEKYGFSLQTVKSGKYKDLGSPARPLTDEEKQMVQEISDQVYEEFVNGIAKSRSMDANYLKTLAQGQVFLGKQAVRLGLADSLGNREDAMSLAAQLAGIKGKPQTIELAPKKSWQEILNELAGTFGYGLGQGIARVSSGGGVSILT